MIPIRDDNPTLRRPVVTTALLVVMAAAFVPAKITAGGLGPGDLGLGLQSGLLSMFLHGGWMHFLGNMLFLWIFGDNVEDRLGHVRYLVFYILCGYAATFAHAFFNPASTMPAIGASGAISGVLGAYLFLYPRARIVTLVWLFIFVRFVEIPALVFLPIWFLMQFFSGVSSLAAADQAAGGVARFAHIGGFIAGPLLLLLLGGARRRPGPPPLPSASPW